MGQAKDRGTREERVSEAQFKAALAKEHLNAWQREVAMFRKEYGFDVGLISGVPFERKLVAVNLDELKKRLTKVEEKKDVTQDDIQTPKVLESA